MSYYCYTDYIVPFDRRDLVSKIISTQTAAKIRKLAELAEETRNNTKFAISITRLTSLKSLCADPLAAAQFALYIARLSRDKIIAKSSAAENMSELHSYKELAINAVAELEKYIETPFQKDAITLRKHLRALYDVQNKHENISWGSVRIIKSMDLVVIEQALQCVLSSDSQGYWAYHMARDYAEKYEPSQGTGLIQRSAPMMTDIANFWCQYYFKQPAQTWLDELNSRPAKTPKQSPQKPSKLKAVTAIKGIAKVVKPEAESASRPKYTAKQGQYLAFIYYYTKINKRPPAEADIQKYFEASPSAIHQMIITLEQQGLIERTMGKSRSIRILLSREELPDLA